LSKSFLIFNAALEKKKRERIDLTDNHKKKSYINVVAATKKMIAF